MTLTRMVSLTALMLLVAGCATIETPTRASSLDVAGLTPAVTVAQRSYALQDVQVIMPASLRISEGAGYYPNADVVWRGDPIGDRAQQITAMFETAGDRVSAGLTGDVPVIAVVTLLRFHGLTERTRYSVGGVYSIEFTLEIRNAQTGTVIEPAILAIVTTMPIVAAAAAPNAPVRISTRTGKSVKANTLSIR